MRIVLRRKLIEIINNAVVVPVSSSERLTSGKQNFTINRQHFNKSIFRRCSYAVSCVPTKVLTFQITSFLRMGDFFIILLRSRNFIWNFHVPGTHSMRLFWRQLWEAAGLFTSLISPSGMQFHPITSHESCDHNSNR